MYALYFNMVMSHKDGARMTLNNLTPQNIKCMSAQCQKLLQKVGLEWFASYVVDRAHYETNKQELYSDFVYQLHSPRLVEIIIQKTYATIHMVQDEYQKTGDCACKNGLLSLGQWLGLITLAKDVAIDENHLNLETILTEAFRNGNEDLAYIVPFIGKILGATTKSKTFSPSHPWVLKIIKQLISIKEKLMSVRIRIDIVLIELGNVPKDNELENDVNEIKRALENKLKMDDNESEQSIENQSEFDNNESMEDTLEIDDKWSEQSTENELEMFGNKTEQSIENQSEIDNNESMEDTLEIDDKWSEQSTENELEMFGNKTEQSIENQSEIDNNESMEDKSNDKKLCDSNSQEKCFFYKYGFSCPCGPTYPSTCRGISFDNPTGAANIHNCVKCVEFLHVINEIQNKVKRNYKEGYKRFLEQRNLTKK